MTFRPDPNYPGNSYGYGQDWNRFGMWSPQGQGFAELLGALTYGTGFDLNPFLNIFKYNRQDRLFVQSDQMLGSRMLGDFRSATAGDPSQTWFEGLYRTADAYFLNDKGIAERALRQAAIYTGANAYAYGTGGGSMADLYRGGTADGKYSDALTGLMSAVYNSSESSGSLSKGQQSAILAGMLQMDPSIVDRYRRLHRQEGTEMGKDWDELKDKLKDVSKNLQDFGEAASAWGRVLKTDAVTAMDKINNLLGGVAYGSFYGNGGALAEMAFNVQHTGGVTGRGMDNTVAMIQQAGMYLKQIGGPADTAVNVGTAAMLESTGLAGWRTTQEEADKLAIKANASFQKSEAAALYGGAYIEWSRQFGGSMDPEQRREAYEQWFQSTGGTVTGVNRALGTNYTVDNFRRFARLGDARDFMARSNNFSMWALESSRTDVLNRIGRYLHDNRFTANGINQLAQRTGVDLAELASMQQDQRNTYYEQHGITGGARQQWENMVFKYQGAFQDLSDSGYLGAFSGEDMQGTSRLLSRKHIQAVQRRNQQVGIRTELSRQTSGEGIKQVLSRVIKNNPNFKIGDILVALGGDEISGTALDEAFNLNSDNGTRERVIENVGNMTDEQRRTFRSFMDDFLKKSANGRVTEDDLQDLGAFGLSYDQNTKRLSTLSGGISSEVINEITARRKANRAELAKEDQDLKDRMLKDKTGFEAWKATKDYVKIQAMVNLAREGVEFGKKGDPDINKMQDFLDTVQTGNIDQINTKYDELRKSKFADRIQAEETKVYEQAGISRDQAGAAAAIAQTLSQLIENGNAFRVTLSGAHQE